MWLVFSVDYEDQRKALLKKEKDLIETNEKVVQYTKELSEAIEEIDNIGNQVDAIAGVWGAVSNFQRASLRTKGDPFLLQQIIGDMNNLISQLETIADPEMPVTGVSAIFPRPVVRMFSWKYN
jgi:hypothetical protein